MFNEEKQRCARQNDQWSITLWALPLWHL